MVHILNNRVFLQDDGPPDEPNRRIAALERQIELLQAEVVCLRRSNDALIRNNVEMAGMVGCVMRQEEFILRRIAGRLEARRSAAVARGDNAQADHLYLQILAISHVREGI